jgi:glyoxylase-like metal-dependent hydrolase (beta-lactamase superfamily II)
MTHMDIDHDSGLRLVHDAKQILVSPEERAALRSGQVRYVRRPWKGVSLGLMPLRDDPAAPFAGRSWDVFGDGSVTALLDPGHTQGSVSIRVAGENGFVLIVGDTGLQPRLLGEPAPAGAGVGQEMMKKSLAWVQRERQNPRCLGVLASHDPEEQREIIELQEENKS